ncbi:hypothetical protein [Ornithinibacillus sp. 179-J 7C1 HS]|uniref:hypothetical protein n=1 Tax=Ornithinibacillus sp. 179-J 7C1 HS TaxID=3142384 RepID=UPI0039A1B01F
MSKIDKRDRLEEEPFSYRISKDNTVFITYFGKQVKILKGKEATKFLSKINAVNNIKEEQLVMAKVTGNFKRGNER